MNDLLREMLLACGVILAIATIVALVGALGP